MAVTAPPPLAGCDVAVVGAGIVGLATARELALRHEGLRVHVLERERRIAAHQTGHSSGVVHAGIYYEPGSLKARLCVEGARELYEYCAEREIAIRRSGKLVVAAGEDELFRLDELERRGRANGVAGLRRLGPDEIPEHEPHVRGVAALHSPETGVVDFAAVAAALATDLVGADGEIHTGCEVRAVRESAGAVEIEHDRGDLRAGVVVVCAGAWAERLATASGAPPEPRVVPFRGAYLRLHPERRGLIRASVYPVPDPALPFLGAHLTRGIDGGVLLGPTALMVGALDAYRLRRVRPSELAHTLAWPGTWRLLARHWRAALTEVHRAVRPAALVATMRRLIPELRAADVAPGPAGVRAQALARDGSLVDDFAVSRTDRTIHVRNAPSPAATSCLPLARLIADQLDETGALDR